jgi:phosphate transport system substrate-binding protein
MSSRGITPVELEKLAALGRGDLSSEANEHVVGLDGVAVIVHPHNPLAALDTTALRDIFSGKLKDWSALGGAPGEIHLYARDENSGTFDTFKEIVLRESSLAEAVKRFASSEALSDAVASDPAAIGFIGLPYVRSAKTLAVSEPRSSPLLPTPFTLATESYALSRRLYLYTTDKPRSPWVTELINFALSPRGQSAVAETQFTNLSLVTDSTHCDRQRCPPRYAALVAAAGRISVDVRFKPGGKQPDNRARRDMDRLSRFLRDFHEPKLMLLGFSDNVGDPALNLQLSRERADTVANELIMRGVQPSAVTGFGAELPVASNNSERGRARNRRVEVWFEHR